MKKNGTVVANWGPELKVVVNQGGLVLVVVKHSLDSLVSEKAVLETAW